MVAFSGCALRALRVVASSVKAAAACMPNMVAAQPSRGLLRDWPVSDAADGHPGRPTVRIQSAANIHQGVVVGAAFAGSSPGTKTSDALPSSDTVLAMNLPVAVDR